MFFLLSALYAAEANLLFYLYSILLRHHRSLHTVTMLFYISAPAIRLCYDCCRFSEALFHALLPVNEYFFWHATRVGDEPRKRMEKTLS